MTNNGKLHIVPDNTVCVINHCTGRRKKIDKNDTLSAFCSHHAELFLSLIDMLPNLTLISAGADGKPTPMKLAWMPVETEQKKGTGLWTPGN